MRWELARRRRAVVATVLGVSGFGALVLILPAQMALAVGWQQTAAPTPAPMSVAALRADVTQTSDRLAAATVAWERGETQLGVLVQRKFLTGRSAEQIQEQLQAAQQRTSTLANSLYRNPVDPSLNAVLAGNLQAVTDFLYLKRSLARTGADQRRDLALLTAQATGTQALLQRQDTAAATAIRLQAKLDDALARLQSDAQASQLRLQAAIDELRRRQQAAAERLLGPANSGPACSIPAPPDAINGFLPDAALCPLQTAPGQRLIEPAAAAFDSMSLAYAAAEGTPLCVTDSYRDYASQIQVFASKPNLAATPGRSQHGWGRAVDLCGGVQQYGSPAYLWLKQNAASFGFTHPDWAEPDGSRPEPWHWEFRG